MGCDMKRRRKWRMVKTNDGKRVRLCMWRGARGHVVTFTSPCSGCHEGYESGDGEAGSGCRECGYTGRRRTREWVPLTGKDFEKAYGAT